MDSYLFHVNHSFKKKWLVNAYVKDGVRLKFCKKEMYPKIKE